MTLEQRVAKLERQNRWLQRGGAVVVAVAASVFLVAQGEAKKLPDLEVRSLRVKDDEGNVRASLTSFEQGSLLGLSDRRGDTRFSLGVWGGPMLLFSAGDEVLLGLGVEQDRSIHLELGTEMRLRLTGKRAAFVVENGEGKVIWQTPPKQE